METLKRPHLTTEQLDWAESVGLSPDRAYFLAACPMNTRCGEKGRPERQHRTDKQNRYLWCGGGKMWFMRVKRQDVVILRALSKDINEARLMRDIIEKDLYIKPIHKFLL